MGYGNACRAFDTSAATSLYQDALALAKELGDERAVATMFLELALIAFEDGNYDECERLMDEGRAANERTRSPAVEVMRLETMGQLARHRDGDLELARELVGQALNRRPRSRSRILGSPRGSAARRSSSATLDGSISQSACP